MGYGFREKPQRWSIILITSYEGICCQHDISIDFDLEQLALGSISQLSPQPFPPFHTVLLVRKSLYSIHTYRVESYSPPSQEGNSYINYLEFYCTGDLSILFHFKIYSVWAHCYLFYTWIIIQCTILFNMLLKLFSFGHWEIFHLAPVSLWNILIIVVLLLFFCLFVFSLLSGYLIFFSPNFP